MRKLLYGFLIVVLLTSMFVGVNAVGTTNDEIRIVLNGAELEFDAPPVIRNNRVLVPMRAIFEALGADVYWNEDFQLVGVVKNEVKILAWIGRENITEFTGETFEEMRLQMEGGELWASLRFVWSGIPTRIINDRTFVPLRIISEALGVWVYWDDDTNTVILEADEDFINRQNENTTFFDEFVAWAELRFFEYSEWNLMSARSRFYEVFREELIINTSWGYDGRRVLHSTQVGRTILKYDETYEFGYELWLEEFTGGEEVVEDFIENAFFARNPIGRWEIRFNRDYNWETDIRTIRHNNLIATLYFTGESGESATVYIRRSSNQFAGIALTGIAFEVPYEMRFWILEHDMTFDIDTE